MYINAPDLVIYDGETGVSLQSLLERMGPLFSALILLVVGTLVFLTTLGLACFFWSLRRAAVVAALFTFGCAVGCALAVVAAVLLIGAGSTLTSTSQVVAYLAFLGGTGAVCGVLLARWYIVRSNFSSSGRAAGGAGRRRST
jgi:hypothetical protein